MTTRRGLLLGAGLAATAAGGVALGRMTAPGQGVAAPVASRSSAASVPAPVPSVSAGGRNLLGSGTLVLFQGDSITDASRRRTNPAPNSAAGLGRGYVWLAARQALRERPGEDLGFLNRGISGDTIPRLARRWQQDTIGLHPQVLSILIGVNDYWNRHRHQNWKGDAQSYRQGLLDLLDRTHEALPRTTVVLCEPFVLPSPTVTRVWLDEFPAYQRAVRELAAERQLRLVPFQAVFNRALRLKPASYWLPDGIHPSQAGAGLMAQEWLRVVRGD